MSREPIGFITRDSISELAAGRVDYIWPAGSLRPENEVPVFTDPAPTLKQTGSVVAWECKDYADGWIAFAKLTDALAYQFDTGCVMRPVRASLNTSGDKL